MKKNLHFLLVTLAVTSIFLVALKTYQSAQANVSDNFSGYAWSDNIGWVSFNCTNGGPTGNDICASSSYGVTKDASGNLSGHAWSDNIGWISFNRAETGNPPSGSGTTDPGAGVAGSAIAKLSGSSLVGWARALSATSSDAQTTAPSGPTTVVTTFDYTSASNGQTSTNGQGYFWEVPAGVTSFTAELWGSGGSGGNGSCCAPQGRSGSGGGGGGGSGAYGKTVVQIPAGVTRYYIIVGETGVAPTGNTNTYLMTNPSPSIVGSRLIAGSGSNGGQGGAGGSNASGETQMLWANGGNGGVGGLLGKDSASAIWQVASNGIAGTKGQDGGYTFCGGNGWGYPGAGGNGGSQQYGGTGGLGGKHPTQNFFTTACPTSQVYPPASSNPGAVGGLPGAGGGGGEGYSGAGALGGRGRVVISYTSNGTPAVADNTGGWDGWISFAGTATDNSPYGISLNNTTRGYEGFSWGSTVVGWLTLNPFGPLPTGGGGPTGGNPPPCCGVGDTSPQVLAGASCTITSGSATPARLSSVTWTAGSTGGTLPLTYTWVANCSQGPSSNPTPATLRHTFSAASETCAPTVAIRDSATVPQTVNASCPSATVPASGTLSATLAGRPASALSSQSYLSTVNLRSGNSAAFKTDVASSVGVLTCDLIGEDRNLVTIETISPSGTWLGTNFANSKPLTTSGSPYTYTLTCRNGISPEQTSVVTIKVVNNPTFQEF